VLRAASRQYAPGLSSTRTVTDIHSIFLITKCKLLTFYFVGINAINKKIETYRSDIYKYHCMNYILAHRPNSGRDRIVL